MKKIFFIVIPFILISACNTNEPDNSMISPLYAIKIDSLQIIGKQVAVTATYSISTPCRYYYKTESANDDNVFTSKVFGKYDGESCVQVVSSLKHTEQVNFLTAGIKKLRFWRNDSTYLDTIITLH
ncbi:MAG: hypothetical protein GXO87_13405 [Chlorobi bacterium]|nr:hypothetical protein [Chlorobiota bacterium]